MASGGWSALTQTNAPSARGGMFFFAPDDPSLAYGGNANELAYDDTFSLELSGGVAAWTALPLNPKPPARSLPTVFSFGRGRYVAGGQLPFTPYPATDLWRLDLDTQQWSELTGQLGHPGCDGSSAVPRN